MRRRVLAAWLASATLWTLVSSPLSSFATEVAQPEEAVQTAPAVEDAPDVEPEEVSPESEPEETSPEDETEIQPGNQSVAPQRPQSAPVQGDQSLSAMLTGADGKVYTVTVNYDDAAMIPDGAELTLSQPVLAPEDPEAVPEPGQRFATQEELDRENGLMQQALEIQSQDHVFFNLLMDITLTVGGVAIQPKAPVEVVVETNAVAPNASDSLEAAVWLLAEPPVGDQVDEPAEPLRVSNLTDELTQELPEQTDTVRISFTTSTLSVFGVLGVAGVLDQWSAQGVTLTVLGSRYLPIEVQRTAAKQPEEGLVLLDAFSVQMDEQDQFTHEVDYWITAVPEDLETTGTPGGYLLVKGKPGAPLFDPEAPNGPARFAAGQEIAVLWDTGLRNQTLELEDVKLDGMLPENATAEAVDVSTAFDDPVAVADNADNLDASDGQDCTVLSAYDISIAHEEGDYQPDEEHPVTVSITGGDIDPGQTLEIWHILDDGTVEIIRDVNVEGNTISFEATGFSVYLVVQITKEQILTAGDGKQYKITVTYDSDAGIPEDAELSVSELTEGKEYDKYVKKAVEAIGTEQKHLVFAHAFDITLVNPETGAHYQPKKAVKVSAKLLGEDVKSGDSVNVVHFGEKAQVLESRVSAEQVEFETDGFSVYVIVENVPTRVYQFLKDTSYDSANHVWTQEYTEYRQVLENGDELIQPTNPTASGREFLGWKKVLLDANGQPVLDANNQPTLEDVYFNDWGTVTGIQPNSSSGGNTVITRESFVLAAVFSSEKVRVTYRNQSGKIVRMETVDKGATFTPSLSYTPIQDVEGSYLVFRHWTLNLDTNEAAGEITANTDLNLYAVVDEAHYIYFDGNSESIGNVGTSYTAALMITPGGKPGDSSNPYDKSKLKPTATGYAFAGWYVKSDPDTTEQVFDANGNLVEAGWNKLMTKNGATALNNDVTLYAHWTAQSASFTVAYYAQKTTDAVGLPDSQKKYDFISSKSGGSRAIGSTVGYYATRDNIQTVFDGVDDYRGFELNLNNSPDVVVKADGSAVLSIRFDRKTFTLSFRDYDREAYFVDNNNWTSARDMSDSEITKNITNYYYVKSNQWTNQSCTSQPAYPELARITALYGSDITEAFESAVSGTGHYYFQNADGIKCDRYQGYTFSLKNVTWWDADGSSSTLSPRPTAGTGFKRLNRMPVLTNQTEYLLHNNYDSTNKYVRYYREVISDSGINYNETVPGTNNIKKYVRVANPLTPTQYRTYEYYYQVSHGWETLSEALYFGNVEGFTQDFADPAYTNGSQSAGELITHYYKRDQHKVTLIDNVNNRQKEVLFKFGETISEDDLAEFPAIENVERKSDDCYWYQDPGCTVPVSFDNLVMRTENLTLYAGLKKSYLVKIYPDGGELLGGKTYGNNYSSWFHLEKNKTITPYNNITRDYIQVDAMPEDMESAYYYDYHPYSPEEEAKPKAERQRFAAYTKMDEAHKNGDIYVSSPGAYSLAGWFEVPDGQDPETWVVPSNAAPFDFGTKVTKNISLKAKWIPMSTFRVDYDAVDYDTGESVRAPVDSNTYVFGAEAQVLAPVDLPTGKQFDHWEIVKDSSHAARSPNTLIAIKDEYASGNADGTMHITLRAVYRPGRFKDNYTADYYFQVKGADPELWYKQRISPGEALVVPKTPSKAGYGFTGWYEDEACTRPFTGFGTIAMPKETVLWAGFTKTYHVVYYDAKQDGNDWVRGDNILRVETYAEGETLSTKDASYTVDTERYVSNWNVEKADGAAYSPATVGYHANTSTIAVSEDLVLWPNLLDYQYLHFNSMGGSEVASQRLSSDSGRYPYRPKEPTRANYSFVGWFPTSKLKLTSAGKPDRSTEYNFDTALPSGVTTLYAWWIPAEGVSVETDFTVVWEVETADGNGEYEYVSSRAFSAPIGSEVNLLDNTWKASNIDVQAGSNLGRYADEGETSYFEFTSSDSTEYKPSETVKTIDSDGSTVFYVRFHRKRYWFAFNTDGKGNIYYGNKSYPLNAANNQNDYYFIQVWLNKDITNEWPIVDEENRGADASGNYAKAALVMKDTDTKYNTWKLASGTNQATLATVADKSRLSAATSTVGTTHGTNNTLLFSLRTSTTASTLTYHYIKDGAEDTDLKQTLNRTVGSTLIKEYYKKNGTYQSKYTTAFGTKELDGYDRIASTDKDTAPSDATPLNMRNGKQTAGYNYIESDQPNPCAEYITGTQVSAAVYSYSQKNSGRQYYNDKNGNQPIEIVFLKNGQKDAYRFYYTDSNGVRREKTSGSFYYFTSSWIIFEDRHTVAWNDFKETEIKETITTQTSDNNAQLYFYYKAKMYTVYLKLNQADTNPKTVSIKYLDPVDDEVDVSIHPKLKPADDDAPKQNQEFVGWSLSETTYVPFTGRMPSHDVTLFARWQDKTVKVTTVGYDENGDPVDDPEDSHVYQKPVGSLLREFNLHNPKSSVAGMQFIGWEDAEKHKWTGGDTTDSDLELYPIWKSLHAESVTYSVNGGSAQTTPPIPGTVAVDGREGFYRDTTSYLKGADAIVKDGGALTKDGQPFASWNTQPDGKGTSYYPGDTISLPDNGVTLYACFTAKREITLVYHLNGGERFEPEFIGTVATEVRGSNTVVKIYFPDYDTDINTAKFPNAIYTASRDKNNLAFKVVRDGYTFKGWSEEPDGSVTVGMRDIIRFNTLGAENGEEHLYAIWEEKTPVTVTVNKTWTHDDGSGYAAGTNAFCPPVRFELVKVEKPKTTGPLGIPMDNSYLWPSLRSDFDQSETYTLSKSGGFFLHNGHYYVVFDDKSNVSGAAAAAGPDSFSDCTAKFTGQAYTIYDFTADSNGNYLRGVNKGDVFRDTISGRYYVRTVTGSAKLPTKDGSGWYQLSAQGSEPDLSYTDQTSAAALIARLRAQFGDEKVTEETSDDFVINSGSGWTRKIANLDPDYYYFAIETEVDGQDVYSDPSSALSQLYSPGYTYSAGENTTTISNVFDPIARVSNDGGTTWSYHSCLVTDTTYGEGAFDKANELTGTVIIETLKRGTYTTTIGGAEATDDDTNGRYTLLADESISLFSKASEVTLRTTQDGPWNDGAAKFRSTLLRGSDNKKSLFTVGANKSLTTEHIILDGGAKFDLNKWDTKSSWPNTGLTPNGAGFTGGGIAYVAANAALTIGKDTVMQNSDATSSGYKKGGAVYCEGTVTVSGDASEGKDSVLIQNCKADEGGGIYTTQAELTVSNATFKYCCVKNGGGGIRHEENESASTKTIVSNCRFDRCYSSGTDNKKSGSGIRTNTAEFRLTDSNFTECKSGRQGGAVYHNPKEKDNTTGTTTYISGCSFSHCEAGYQGVNNQGAGGALEAGAADVDIICCTFTDCKALSNAGAVNIYNTKAEIALSDCSFLNCSANLNNSNDIGFGGAFRTTGKKTDITDCTFENCHASKGGAICCNGGSNVTTITMTDPTKTMIKDCTAKYYGGALFQLAGTLKINSGNIQNCSAPNGGAIYQGGGTFNFEGGTISGCSAANVSYVQADNKLTVSLDAASGNTYNGGGVYLGNGTFKMEGTGGTISQCKAVSSGGGVYLGKGTFTMSSGLIDQCVAKTGGGVSAHSDATMTINKTGDAITNCRAANVSIQEDVATATDLHVFGNHGGGIYLDGGSPTINSTIRGCSAYDGGGLYLGGRGALVMGTDASVITDCTAANSGAGIYQSEGTLTINRGKLKGNRAAESGGGIYLGGGTFTINGGEIGCADESDGKGGTVENANKAKNGAGIYQGGGTLSMTNGSIRYNVATEKGGGIYLGGGAFTLGGGVIGGLDSNDEPTDEKNTAQYGGGLYVANGEDKDHCTSAIIKGGTIGGNHATEPGGGGGIYPGGANVRLYFEGSIQVWGNTMEPTEKNTNQKRCDVCLDYDTNEIIRTTATGLNEASHIGVYVTDKPIGTSKILHDHLHGTAGKPFGTFDSTGGGNGDSCLNRFINNRSGAAYQGYEYYYGVRKPESEDPDHRIYWADYICEITDAAGNLLFTNDKATAPALYQYLGKQGAFEALRNHTTFYTRGKQEYRGTEFYVKMLVFEYNLHWQESVTVPGNHKITLTMADENDNNLPDDRKGEVYAEHDGCTTINRGSCTQSMFVSQADSDFTLTRATLDGGATWVESTKTFSDESECVNVTGGLIKAGGALTLDNKAVLRNSLTTNTDLGGGAAIAVDPATPKTFTITLKNGSKIQRCKATNGGLLYVADSGKTVTLNNEGAAISDITADNGGYVYLQSGTLELNSSFTGGTAANGGQLYVNGGTLKLNGTLTGGTATSGGQLYVNNGELRLLNGALTGGKATNGGCAYVNGGTLKIDNPDSATLSGHEATENGGGVYVGSSGTFRMYNGEITGNSAKIGAGAFVNAGGKMYMNGWTGTGQTESAHVRMTDNTASVKGGGIAVGGETAELHFNNLVTVTDNKMPDPKNASKTVACNVYLDRDSNDVIRYDGYLNTSSKIGVYASDDALTGGGTVRSKHGTTGKPFGQWTNKDNNPSNLQCFVNDRSQFLYGTRNAANPNDTKIYWVTFVCKITTPPTNEEGTKDSTRLLYRKLDDGSYSPAVYAQLGKGQNAYHQDYAFNALMDSTLYTKDDDDTYTAYTTNDYWIQMLVPSYTWRKYINVNKKVTFTTASTEADEEGFCYPDDDEHPYATILRSESPDNGSANSSMFTVRGSMTLMDIIIDGRNLSVSNDGALINLKQVASASVTIGENATLKNGCTTGNGGAVDAEVSGQTINVTGGSIIGNRAAKGAGIYAGNGVTLNLSGNPSFGGTDLKGGTGEDQENLKGEDGNFVLKSDTETDKPYVYNATEADRPKNGGKVYPTDADAQKYLVRQDIYLPGNADTLNTLHVTGRLTDPENKNKVMPAGSIWVWADDAKHYKSDKQFAIVENAYKNQASAAELDEVMKAFRNAQDDKSTENPNEEYYLYGVMGTGSNVVWGTDPTGTVRVILKKVGRSNEPLLGAEFELYRGDANIAWPDLADSSGDPVYKVSSLTSGVFYIGTMRRDIYYIKETSSPTTPGYSDNANKWFYLIVHSSGVYLSDEGNTNKDSVIDAAAAKKAELDAST